MQDLLPRSKAVFWGAVLLLLALTMIPSLALMDAAGRYIRFLLEWNPGTIPMTRVGRLPHQKSPVSKTPETRLRFARFELEALKAKQVSVSGDFNDWRPEPLSPSPRKSGLWEVLLALPPGRYRYSFQADGVWTPDPASEESGQKGEIKTSIRQVP